MFVQFTDASQTAILSVFSDPQDPDIFPNQGVVEDTDPRYLAFINPPPDLLAINSFKLQQLTQLATAQKAALTERISTLNDAVELEMSTPEEVAEIPVRTAQLKQWKTYAVLLGRVTTQAGWHTTIVWTVQPLEGMDLTVSSTSPETV